MSTTDTFHNIETGLPVPKGNAVHERSTQRTEWCAGCCSTLCIALAFLFVLGMFFSLPIAEIVMAEKYRQDMSCPNDLISPYTWMLTEGIVGIFIYGLCGILCALMITGSDSSKKTGVVLCIPLWLLSVFHLAWLIVGAVMFWRDCIDLETKSMNDFYWAVLIINFVSLYLSGKNNNKDD